MHYPLARATAPIQLAFPLISEILSNYLPQEVEIRLSCMESCETSQKAKSNYGVGSRGGWLPAWTGRGGILRLGRSRQGGSGNGTEGFENSIHDAYRVELLCSDGSNGWSVDGLGLIDRIDEGIERRKDKNTQSAYTDGVRSSQRWRHAGG